MRKQEQLSIISLEHKGAEEVLRITREELTPVALELANDFAEMNRPTKEDTVLSIYFGKITSGVQSSLEKVYGLLGADTAMASGVSLKERFETQISEKQKEHDTALNEKRVLKSERKKYGDSIQGVFKKWNLVRFLILILLFGEMSINWKIFTLLTGNVYLAIGSAATLSLALLGIVMTQDKVLEMTTKFWIKVSTVLLFTVLVLILLQTLAEMRMSFLSTTNSRISDGMNPFNFVLINAVFYISGMGLSMMYRPTKIEIQKYKKQQTLDKQIEEKKKLAEALKEEFSMELPKEKERLLSERYSIIKLCENYQSRFESLHQELFDAFVSTNILKRTDGITPVVFTQKPRLQTPLK